MNQLQALASTQNAIMEGLRALGQPGVAEHVLASVSKGMGVPCTYVLAPYKYGLCNDDATRHAQALQVAASARIECHSGMPTQFFQHYASHVWRMDPWRDALAAKTDKLMALGGFIGHQHIPHQAMHKTSFYQDYLKPEIGLDSLMSASLEGGYWLGFMRQAATGDFQEADLHFVNQFKNHLDCFLHAHHQFLQLRAEQNQVCHAFDRLPDGVVVVSQQGEIIMRNASASHYLGLPEKAVCPSGSTRPLLLPQIHRVLWTLVQKARFTEKLQSCIASPAYPPGLHASITWQTGAAGAHQSCAYIELSGANRLDIAIQVQKCAKRYGLSATEMTVLASLIDHTPQETADQLGLKISTIRSHLASLFTKTSTRRQSELLWLLAGS